MRGRMLVALGALVAALVVVLPATGSSDATPLTLAVNSDAFKITLTQGGKKVTTLKAGTYTFKLVDKSALHNVDLLKGGKKVKDTKGKPVMTAVSAKQTKSVTVKLAKGTYTFQCDPHASAMKGTFTVS